MFRWMMTGCVFCMCVQIAPAQTAAQEEGVALDDGYRLPMSFPTGGYWPQERMASAAQRAGFEDKWEYAKKLLTDLKTRHHWNTVWVLNIGLDDGKKLLRIAEEVGMWVVLEPTPVTHHFIWYSHASPEAIRRTAQKVVDELGQFMDRNQIALQELGVSSPKLDWLIRAAKSAGAKGAKLSGGGRGGCMIALVDEQSRDEVTSALLLEGATQVIPTVVR